MYEYSATYVKNYDGDTVHLAVDAGFNVTIFERFRLLGINCPEMHGSDKAKAIKARDYLRSLLEGKKLVINTEKGQEKYGRWLLKISVNGLDVNQHMVESGHAVPFMVDG